MSVVRSREAERRSLLGGYFYIKRLLKSIGTFVFIRSREVVRFWEGPLREAPLYSLLLFARCAAYARGTTGSTHSARISLSSLVPARISPRSVMVVIFKGPRLATY